VSFLFWKSPQPQRRQFAPRDNGFFSFSFHREPVATQLRSWENLWLRLDSEREIILYCNQCGSQLASEVRFCSRCGAQQGNVTATDSAEGTPERGSHSPPAGNTAGQSFAAPSPAYCRHCGYPISPQASVCLACGRRPWEGTRFCQACGTELPALATACTKCGTPQMAYSNRSWLAALLFSIFLGCLGVDRFYLGYVGLGILKLITFGAFGIWWLIDLILIAANRIPDRNGFPLRQ
jgi:hypothetical protein